MTKQDEEAESFYEGWSRVITEQSFPDRRKPKNKGKKRRRNRPSALYPKMRIRVVVMCKDDEKVIADYTYWYNKDHERRAFTARILDAYKAGQSVTTYWEDFEEEKEMD